MNEVVAIVTAAIAFVAVIVNSIISGYIAQRDIRVSIMSANHQEDHALNKSLNWTSEETRRRLA